MPLPSTGPLSLAAIAAEFGDTAPHSLSEFYRGGGKVPNATSNNNIPTSGLIGIGGFYGAVNALIAYVTTTQVNLNVDTYFGSAYNADIPKILIINPGVYVGSNTRTYAALSVSSTPGGSLTIDNYGFIHGAGGVATNEAGGDAIQTNAYISVINRSGAQIYGGGGAGGVGGQGGQGGDGYYYGEEPNCSPIRRLLGRCTIGFFTGPGGIGGVGGEGGRGQGFDGGVASGFAGGPGQPGVPESGAGGNGGYGGAGGLFGNPGVTGYTGQTGFNGNSSNGLPGLSGGAGGAPGRYINGIGLVSLTNYGSLAGGTI